MTGNIGRPGTGANSITGQCNAMGSRLFSNTTNLLGGRDFANAEHRAEGRRRPRHRRGAHPRRTELGLRPDHRRASARARSAGCGSSPRTRPTRGSTRTGLREHPRPARFPRRAGHVPHDRDGPAGRPRAAGRRLGREGRHVHQLRAADRAGQEGPPRARARRWPTSTSSSSSPTTGAAARCSPSGSRPRRSFRSSSGSPRAGRATSPGIADYHMLDEPGGIQWPYPAGGRRPRPRSGGSSPTAGSTTPTAAPGSSSRSRGRLPEPPTASIPFLLLTGRGSAAQWHTQTRTAKSAVLRKLYPQRPLRRDPSRRRRRLGVRPGRRVVVESRRGSARARAFVTPTVPRGRSSCRCTTSRPIA